MSELFEKCSHLRRDIELRASLRAESTQAGQDGPALSRRWGQLGAERKAELEGAAPERSRCCAQRNMSLDVLIAFMIASVKRTDADPRAYHETIKALRL